MENRREHAHARTLQFPPRGDFACAVKEINRPFFRVCLDTGHCAVFGDSPADAVRLIGKEYLSTLHVHDNDGCGDCHWLPGAGVVDWQDFSDALAEIGFEGSVSLETAVDGNIPEPDREAAEIAPLIHREVARHKRDFVHLAVMLV